MLVQRVHIFTINLSKSTKLSRNTCSIKYSTLDLIFSWSFQSSKPGTLIWLSPYGPHSLTIKITTKAAHSQIKDAHSSILSFNLSDTYQSPKKVDFLIFWSWFQAWRKEVKAWRENIIQLSKSQYKPSTTPNICFIILTTVNNCRLGGRGGSSLSFPPVIQTRWR